MNKLYDDIEEVIKHHRDASYLGEIIWKIAIKEQIELLEELRIYVLKQGSNIADKIEQNLYDRIQDLQKQLEA